MEPGSLDPGNAVGQCRARKTCLASMEPGSLDPGNESIHYRGAIIRTLLQWSRDHSIPEMTATADREGSSRLRASMEPGSLDPGNTRPSTTSIRRSTASMEPGSLDPGNTSEVAESQGRRQCFNGAGITRSRKSRSPNTVGISFSRFNGAGITRSRKCGLYRMRGRIKRASMEPGSLDPGNKENPAFAHEWHLASMEPGSLDPGNSSGRMPTTIASMEPGSLDPGNSVSAAPLACFNGAGITRSRKCRRRRRSFRFNGAGITRSRKCAPIAHMSVPSLQWSRDHSIPEMSMTPRCIGTVSRASMEPGSLDPGNFAGIEAAEAFGDRFNGAGITRSRKFDSTSCA